MTYPKEIFFTALSFLELHNWPYSTNSSCKSRWGISLAYPNLFENGDNKNNWYNNLKYKHQTDFLTAFDHFLLFNLLYGNQRFILYFRLRFGDSGKSNLSQFPFTKRRYGFYQKWSQKFWVYIKCYWSSKVFTQFIYCKTFVYCEVLSLNREIHMGGDSCYYAATMFSSEKNVLLDHFLLFKSCCSKYQSTLLVPNEYVFEWAKGV